MTTWGASADQLEAVAAAMGQAADLIDSNRGTINAQLHHAPWKGPEADQFRQDWDGIHFRSLASAAVFLRDSRVRLLQNAAQQLAASSAGTGTAQRSDHSGPPPSLDANRLYRVLNDALLPGVSVLGSGVTILVHGLDSPLARAIDRGSYVILGAQTVFDVGKFIEHAREHNTSDELYDYGHLVEDAALGAALAIGGVPALVVGGVIAVGTLLWDYGAHDQAVMKDMHSAGDAYRQHHYAATALDVGKGLAQLVSDTSFRSPLTPLPVMRFASTFLHRL